MNFDFESYDPKDIITRLGQQVTPERFEKIKKVASQRFQHTSVVLESIYDRGNASAVMRSAEAFGFFQFHMVELQEKFKESKRVTQGAHKWIQSHRWTSTKDCISNLKKTGQKIFVTHLDPKARPLQEMDVTQPFAICFGNEKEGASKELLATADETIFIPMKGFVQSFNISVAAAICFYDLQRRLAPPTQLDESLVAYYLTQSVDHWQRYLEHSV